MENVFTETDNYEMYPSLKYDENRANHIYGICGIEVLTESDAKTLALFGDSITHMSYYSDVLIDMATHTYPGKLTVVNRGLGGNRLLHDYTRMLEIPSGGTIFGAPGIERFLDDIYQRDIPDFVVVLIGINDFTHPYFFNRSDEIITLEEYEDGIRKLIDKARSKGSKILIGTVLPFRKEEVEWFYKAENLRQEANRWIREQKEADGVIDFDLAIRDIYTPEKIDDSCHLGDGIHPNEVGGRRMAIALPLETLIKK
jgi:lysophospholipase L1-like esterase